MIVEAHKVRKSRTVDFFQRFCRTEITPVAMSVMQMSRGVTSTQFVYLSKSKSNSSQNYSSKSKTLTKLFYCYYYWRHWKKNCVSVDQTSNDMQNTKSHPQSQVNFKQTYFQINTNTLNLHSSYIDHYNARTLAAGNVDLQDDIFLDERSCRRC